MNQYIGVKLLNAKPMARGEYNSRRGWVLPAGENPLDEGYLVEYVDRGHPNHPDYENYISWTPKDVFEQDYRRSNGMPIGLAIEALKKGFKVARGEWNGNQLGGFIPQARAPIVYDGLGYILLASGGVAIFDADDFGLVAIQENWCLMGNGYPSFTDYSGESAKTVKLHQLLFPGWEMADHINGDRLDNRRANLRECTAAENNANRSSMSGSSSKFKGVTWDKSRNKWMAAIQASGRPRTIGRFDNEEDAARAYDAEARKAYGRFARLNFPNKEPHTWLTYSPEAIDLPANQFFSKHNKEYAEKNGGMATVCPSIMIKNSNGTISYWQPSLGDMFATDWSIVS